MALSKPAGEYEAVQTWFDGLRQQWGEEPTDWAERLKALDAFCAFVDKDPDAMVGECLRQTASGTRISAKGRRFYNDKIAEWQASVAGNRAVQGRAGNAVRSFLIHNGVFLQSGVQA
ncbi:MAG TPA: hypothetical protein VJN32_01175 [Dehalococcoidia bacterium]|nr:hypothetical protein [Dehalococcoidia bacterium]